MIVIQVLSTIKLVGWTFGLIESTCVIVFIGISVDYVVHFSLTYVSSSVPNRRERTQLSFKLIGETILGGTLTSCCSGAFLILCESYSLNKFGLLLLTTIISSMIISLIYLPGVLYVFGPNEN